MSAVRFVILHHCQGSGEHWDLMIEQPETLATWQLSRNPLAYPGETISARRISDHRKAYLDYQGPVSGNRGTVHRVESGQCTVEKVSESAWCLHLKGSHLTGAFELVKSGIGVAEEVAEGNAREANEAFWIFQPGSQPAPPT